MVFKLFGCLLENPRAEQAETKERAVPSCLNRKMLFGAQVCKILRFVEKEEACDSGVILHPVAVG